MKPTMAEFFQTHDSDRDKFLARLFGLFSESLVRDWCSDPRSPYLDRGRPTLWAPKDVRGSTLDFTLQDRTTGKTYVAEMKAELEFERYRYLTLRQVDQLKHHGSPAFRRLRDIARDPAAYEVRVQGKPIDVDGAILIWGAVEDEGRASVIEETGMAAVLSFEAIIRDLRAWSTGAYTHRVNRLEKAAADLFAWLV